MNFDKNLVKDINTVSILKRLIFVKQNIIIQTKHPNENRWICLLNEIMFIECTHETLEEQKLKVKLI